MTRRSSFTVRIDIAEFIDDRLGIKHRGHGGHGTELICACPFCGSPKTFWINATSGCWTCYRCEESGSFLKLVRELDDLTPAEARRFVCGSNGDREKPTPTLTDLQQQIQALLDPEQPVDPGAQEVPLPAEFIPIWSDQDRTWRIPAYLTDRGITARTAATFGLGFCLDGPYHHRVILPAHMDGKIRMWQGRAMGPIEPRYHGPAAGKGQALFGYDEAVGFATVLLVEGPFDVINLHQKGYPAVAAMGRTITLAQATALARGGFTMVIVMWDPPEKDGRSNAADPDSAAAMIGEVIEEVLVAIPSGVHDPGDSSVEEIEAALATARSPSLRGRLRSMIGS